MLTEAPMLTQPKSGKEFVVFSVFGMCFNAYASQQLKVHKKNYLTYELELAAVVFALKIWLHYLYGEKCHIYTDHKSLKYLMTQKELNLWQHRWLELLKGYDLVIDYHLGKANVVVDALSRKYLFALRLMIAQLNLGCDGSILKIWELQFDDSNLLTKQKLVEDRQTTDFSVGLDHNLYYCNRLCVPDDSPLKQNILNEAHSSVYSLYPGNTKIYCNMNQIHWWSRMKCEIFEFVSKCLVCLQVKAKHQVQSGLLQPIIIPEWK
ncbi:integrase [Gossypium australe]|uniref:Integrase n=1 Tax=Gossypium australe TaxID=47621 RepID=A0A5B6X249_9ROSI|nr:integrase [Gossypium australe]